MLATYKDLRKGDRIWFYGAEVIIKKVDRSIENYTVFEIRPCTSVDRRILSEFYGTGWYGGYDSNKVSIYIIS